MLGKALLLSLLCVDFFSLAPAAAAACVNSDTSCLAEEIDSEAEATDDSVLLQTLHQMEYNKGVAASSALEKVEEHVAASPKVCTGKFVDIFSHDPHLHITSLPSIAGFTVKRDCLPPPSISLISKEETWTRSGLMSHSTYAYITLGSFIGAFLLLVLYLLRTVMFPSRTKERLDEQAKTRAEQEAWNSGLLSWITMSWVDVWVAHWGTSFDPSQTKIYPSQLGAVACQADEAHEVGEALDKLWQEEQQKPVQSEFALAKVVLRYVGPWKLFSMFCLVGATEFFMFLGPTIATHRILVKLREVHAKYELDPSSMTAADCFYPSLFVIAVFLGGGLALFTCDSLNFMILNRNSIRLRSGLNTLCFKKAQRLHGGVSEFFVPAMAGQPPLQYSFVTLINNDVHTALIGFFINLFHCFLFPPTLIFLFVLCLQTIEKGVVFVLGAQLLLLAGILITSIGQARKLKSGTDFLGMRISLCQEIFQGVRLIKAYAWEIPMLRKLSKLRKVELEHLASFYRWTGAFALLSLNVPRVMIMASLGGYVLLYGDIDAVTIFTMMQILRSYTSLLREMSNFVPNVARMYPSIARLQIFLRLPESDRVARLQKALPTVAAKGDGLQKALPTAAAKSDVIVKTKGTFTFDPELKAFLRDIDVEIKKGELVAIVGEVGSGKTALMTAMLGEMHGSGGSVTEAPDLIAYHAQVPMISEGTLQHNVIFWRDFDQERYDAVLRDACLMDDLKFLPGQDGCSIGHRGVALSGGQRARVSLARLAYSKDAEVMLMDDPFSSVDMETAEHLLHNLVLGDSMKSKTRIVVTQPDVDRLQHFDRVIVMSNGQIAIEGPLEDVMSHSAFEKLLKMNEDGTTLKEIKEPGIKKTKSAGKADVGSSKTEAKSIRDEEAEGRADWGTIDYFFSMGGYWNTIGYVGLFGLTIIMGVLADIVLAQWGSAELHGIHRPSTFLYAYLFWLSASVLVFFPFWYCLSSWGMNISNQIFDILCKNLMEAPIDSFHDRHPLGRILNRLSSDMIIIDYQTAFKMWITLAMVFFYFVPVIYMHSVLPYWFSLSSLSFYFLLFYILRRYWNVLVPMRYLSNVTRSSLSSYVGDAGSMRITLRAYNVEHRVEGEQSVAVDDAMKTEMASNISRKWVVIRMGLLYIFFLTSTVLLSVWCPGIVSIGHVSLCINYALQIICDLDYNLENASGAQFELINMNRLHEYTDLPKEKPALCQDDSKYTCFFVKIKRMELGNLKFVIGNGDLISIMRNGRPLFEETDDRKAFQLAKNITWADAVIDSNAHPELTQGYHWHRLVAVDFDGKDPKSIAEILCNGKETELTLCLQSNRFTQGARIVVKNLRAGYSKFPDTLHGINMEIPAMSKTAIMGPTGCGKSTFMQCLLRMLEPRINPRDCPEAPITMNGVDITEMGLRTLRTLLGLVPQDPVLFSGSLRMNLDPFDEHSDDRLWKALSLVKLGGHLLKSACPHSRPKDDPSKLTAGKEVAEMRACLGLSVRPDGENLSFGQRQLLCIARMILRQPLVLLLDECTSSIDPRTQQMVQEAIRVGFPKSTTIAIAHRLETIMDFDQVVVINRGRDHKTGCPRDFKRPEDLLKWATSEDSPPSKESLPSIDCTNNNIEVVRDTSEA